MHNAAYHRKRKYILLFKCLKGLGFLRGVWLFKSYFLLRRKQYSIRGFQHPVYLRPGSTDLDVLLQFLSDKHYDITYPADINYILDGGGNIGLAAVFFANKFPQAKIISIEPDPENFHLLEKNIQQYPNIIAVKAGLWSKDTFLEIYNEGEGKWALMVKESNDENGIIAVSIPSLLKQFNIIGFDLVKLDIEGSEKEVFESEDRAWLETVKVLIVEFHDHMRKGTAYQALRFITSRPFQMVLKDENLIFIYN